MVEKRRIPNSVLAGVLSLATLVGIAGLYKLLIHEKPENQEISEVMDTTRQDADRPLTSSSPPTYSSTARLQPVAAVSSVAQVSTSTPSNPEGDPALKARVDRYLKSLEGSLAQRLSTLELMYASFQPNANQDPVPSNYSRLPQNIQIMLTQRTIAHLGDPSVDNGRLLPWIAPNGRPQSVEGFLPGYQFDLGQKAVIARVRTLYESAVALFAKLCRPGHQQAWAMNQVVYPVVDAYRGYKILPNRSEAATLFPSDRLSSLRREVEALLRTNPLDMPALQRLMDGLRILTTDDSQSAEAKALIDVLLAAVKDKERWAGSAGSAQRRALVNRLRTLTTNLSNLNLLSKTDQDALKPEIEALELEVTTQNALDQVQSVLTAYNAQNRNMRALVSHMQVKPPIALTPEQPTDPPLLVALRVLKNAEYDGFEKLRLDSIAMVDALINEAATDPSLETRRVQLVSLRTAIDNLR